MLHRLGGLLALLALLAGPARAQIITDPARATAARDTLLRQAAQLRLGAEQATAFFTTNARNRSRRRVVVRGICRQNSGTLPNAGVRKSEWAADNTAWRHITRYRRNGRVQERYSLTVGNKILLKERLLNGTVIWLSTPFVYPTAFGAPIRHRGLYLRTGYIILDKDQYALPAPL